MFVQSSMKISKSVSELLRGYDIQYSGFQREIISKKSRWSYGTCSLHIDIQCFIFVQSFMNISKRVSELLRD